ncbi:glycosyltransferase [Candidatus Magnetobacterium bavaricum]|uniref:Glycosyltransferase n=1 Tax=Candidatus Magnetobacterium bavaricum TaxID=29290 RepID=A0A0F3GKE7_9BACT|nr:glycosyltransferase [Candidatus Magnetobacterium bavaricum]
MPELTVIIATYKENVDYLKNCIDSILSQTYDDFELFVIVEPDETNMDLLNKFTLTDKRLKVLQYPERLGIANSRNKGIIESRGAFIALADGDDYYNAARFERQVKFLKNNPEISVVGSNMYLVDEKNNIIGERTYPEKHKDIKKQFLIKMAIANPSVMVRKTDFDEVGYFDKDLSKAEDFDLWLRFLVHQKKLSNLSDSLVYYRTPRNTNVKRGCLHYKNYYKALKKHGVKIWPFHHRLLSLLMFYVISHMPDYLLDYLLNLNIVKRIKSMKTY